MLLFDVTELFLLICFCYLQALQATIGRNLPDKGARLARMEQQIIERIISIKGGEMTLMEHQQNNDNVDVRSAAVIISILYCLKLLPRH